MPRYYFDCLCDGVLHFDDFGLEILDEEIADQAQAVVMNILEESLPIRNSSAVIVTVRTEQRQPVYVSHGMIGGTLVRQDKN